MLAGETTATTHDRADYTTTPASTAPTASPKSPLPTATPAQHHNGGDLVMRVQPRQERPAKPCAQILGTAQTSTAAITPKACAAARANPRRAKSNAWGRKKGGASGRCGRCHPMSGEHASSARVDSAHYLLYTRVLYRHEGPEEPSTWDCDAPDGQLGSSLAAPSTARHRGPDI
jgi:hypothetical protein